MAQRSLDHLGVGLRLGPVGYTLVKKACRHAVVASADQDQPIFDAIPGYLAAARDFARLMSATLMPPKAGQPSALELTIPHPDATRSTSNDAVAAQSRHNHWWRRVRPAVRRGDAGEERHSPTSNGGQPPEQAACGQQQRSMTRSWDPAGRTLTLKRETQAPTLFCGYGVVLLT